MSAYSSSSNQNRNVALSLLAIVVGMLMLSYASVPLYRLFCQVTGFGGTTQQAEILPQRVLEREMTVSFTANVQKELEWDFEAPKEDVTLKVGERQLVAFDVTNLSEDVGYGMSVFNVTPHKAGAYFMKVECFCYEEQRVNPGETVHMPVSFFIDPSIENDPDLADLNNITLSYTFFKVKEVTLE